MCGAKFLKLKTNSQFMGFQKRLLYFDEKFRSSIAD